MHRVGAAPAVLGLALITFIAAAWVYLGGTFVVVLLPTVVALVVWLKTTYPHPVRSERVVAIYLLAIAVQFVHLSEEFANRFWDYYNAMFAPAFLWDERFFTMLFILAFPFPVRRRRDRAAAAQPLRELPRVVARPRPQYGQPWGAPGVPVYLWRPRGRAYTAPLHGAMSVFLLWTLVRHHRDNVAAARRPAPLRVL